jgi:hypothetical protein
LIFAISYKVLINTNKFNNIYNELKYIQLNSCNFNKFKQISMNRIDFQLNWNHFYWIQINSNTFLISSNKVYWIHCIALQDRCVPKLALRIHKSIKIKFEWKSGLKKWFKSKTYARQILQNRCVPKIAFRISNSDYFCKSNKNKYYKKYVLYICFVNVWQTTQVLLHICCKFKRTNHSVYS